MARDTLYLENLEEYIFDEDKVVTYKWLSHALSVHVNQAKQMIEEFIDSLKSKPGTPAVNVTYLLSGVQKTENGVDVKKVALVLDKNIVAAEAALTHVTSKHVYSIQKAALKDANSLYMTDYQTVKDNIKQPNRFSSIRCPEAKPRTPAELSELSGQLAPTGTPPRPRVNGSAESHVVQNLKQEPVSKNRAAGSGRVTTNQITAFAVSGGSKTTRGMSEDKSEKETTSSRPKEEKKPNANSKSKGSLISFWNRAAPAPKKERSLSPEETQTGRVQETKGVETKAPETKGAGTKTRNGEDGRVKRKANKIDISDSSDSDEKSSRRQTAKRRRRILKQDVSSSSSSENESDMEDSPIPPTPPPPPAETETIAQREDTGHAKGASGKARRRKRVLRSRMTLDEDGCMVTEKVWETESTDVSDEELPPKKATPTKATPTKARGEGGGEEGSGSRKKTSPGSSGKKTQRSLLSFFKKK